ncbi:MAG: zinc-ribbon domain-containing protein [Candidatus Rokubacteria bacterium]|nr:zinc-ribbon domain-containing protein [Candidatus Rokubacteria bacterium]
MVCPSCRAENPPEHRFCEQCGTPRTRTSRSAR